MNSTGSRGGQEKDVAGDDEALQLLEIVKILAVELHPQDARRLRVTLDSTLDRDLGFDSLSRVELMLRIERAFSVSLPERLLAGAETPRDLLQALHTAASGPISAAPGQQAKPAALEETTGRPDNATTLIEALDWHLGVHPQRTHVYLYGEGQEPEEISYEGLRAGAGAMAAGLQSWGLEPGSTVAIMLPTGRDYLFSFFGILMAGGIPVPIYPPARLSQLEDHMRRHAGILDNARTTLLITMPEARVVARLLRAQVDGLRDVVTPDELAADANSFRPVSADTDDTAFIQYTSGSTGQPKGVVLSHGDLLANIRAMGDAVQADSTDVFVSWLPLYHDMGLIGAWLGSLYFAMPLVLMSPLTFLAHPSRWLWTIHNHGGTLSAAPNFAYELCLTKLLDSDIEGLDLGSWRMAFNGAEPVSPNTLRKFRERFAAYGFRNNVLAPVYGLAEAAVGLAFPPIGREPPIDRVQRGPLLSRGEALPPENTDTDTLEFVPCGQPLTGYQIRVVDPTGRELQERREGRVQFQGPSATRGYFRNPEATGNLFDGEWLNTGDLGYIANGDLYLTSRVKDLIIRGGRNIYPYEVEEAAGEITGIRKGCVAMFGSLDPGSGTERVVLVAESRETDPGTLEALREKIRSLAVDILGMPPDEVVLAPPHTVLKTSSGKIRRTAVRDLYEKGEIGKGTRAVWWQFTRLALASVGPRLRNLRRQLPDSAYALYVRMLFWLLAPPVWLLVVMVPGRQRCWRLMGAGARLLFRLAGIPLITEGFENLPKKGSCVLVSNHASYLDGVVLVASLSGQMGFVAKEALEQQVVPRLFLKKIGAIFVERFDRQRGVADARQITQALQGGESILFFPEGTLRRAPGLLPFHMGAFTAAAEANVPVVPVIIRGTRSVLRDQDWYPRRGRVIIRMEKPIVGEGSDWGAAVKLRDASRATILQHLGEPDLASERPIV